MGFSLFVTKPHHVTLPSVTPRGQSTASTTKLSASICGDDASTFEKKPAFPGPVGARVSMTCAEPSAAHAAAVANPVRHLTISTSPCDRPHCLGLRFNVSER
eukprot:TRINITY_DN17278_c0_g1_i7.p2 TRINITY_DN17278_c0_g1~~TRINITY_DN17278_c0_g1_i7.p2  ORF type:complete len:102 (-),score=0.35 TRINITY_DN17278_c0_g1_i7:29-334(-)